MPETLRQTENLRRVFEAVPGAYLILRPDLVIVGVTDAYLRATMTERGAIVGRPLFEVFPDEPGDTAATGARNLRASLDRVIADLEPDTMPLQRYPIRRPDGSWEDRDWLPTNSPVLVGGRLAYIVHAVEDVTALEEARRSLGSKSAHLEALVFTRAAEIDENNRRLAAAIREREAFSYSVSHDLAAPMREIVCAAETLRAEIGDNPHLTRIIDAVGRGQQLRDDLLRLSQAERASLHRERVDLSAVARSVGDDLLRTSAPAVFNVQSGLVADADPGLLRIALENLLGNAWKFTATVERVIDVGRDGGAFFVRDNGVGFKTEDAGRIFEAFTRLRSDIAGTGIGLATVRRIVERHGGSVWAEGEPGKGATVWFSFGGAA